MLLLRKPMPRPIYIICSRSGSEDKLTGLISHFEVIEQLEIREKRADEALTGFSLRIVAIWERSNAAEAEQVFAFQNSLLLPPDGKELIIQSGEVSFEKPRHRFTILIASLPPTDVGVLSAVSKLRPLDEKDRDWISQDYPILVVKAGDDETHVQHNGLT